MVPVAAGPTPTVDIETLLAAYRAARRTPTEVVTAVADTLDRRGADGVWISTVDRARLLARAAELEALPGGAERLPLYGVPFAVKDSLHVQGMATTLACPEYATVADETAAVVQLLLDAGAVLVGKTNLDQFATGLNGTRTPYGPPLHSVYGEHLVSGGSSSGSALAVATGQVPFAVATDTAGSGRVPAALNGILGFKPSRGLLSTRGLVPACRSLDCVSLMATTVADLERVFDVVAGPDQADPWSRSRVGGRTGALRIGLPDPADLVFGSRTHGTDDPPLRAAHERACAVLPAVGTVRPVPLAPFLAAGDLLYAGPWVAERTAEFGDFLAAHPDAVLPVVAGIIAGGARWSAVDAFRASYRLAELRAEVTRLFEDVDVVVLPTLATTPSPAQVHAEPIETNTDLGLYTHCGNLLDLCAVVVPAGTTDDGRPVSLMVLGPPLGDDTVLAVARRLTGGGAPATSAPDPDRTTIVVAGHHLSGGARNAELTDRGGRLVAATRTGADHRLLRVDTDTGPVPALLPATTGGAPIEVELWSLPATELPGLLAGVPDVLVLGRIELADGSTAPGLVCAPDVATGSRGRPVRDITASGGWRSYSNSSPSLVEPPPPTPGVAMTTVPADPGPFDLDPASTALLVIDMQRDFLLPGGFGESLGNDVGQLAVVVPPLARLLDAARAAGLMVVHTREGHLPDLSDLPPAKHRRGLPSQRIGDPGPYGRILVRGEFGHDIVDELAPMPGEPVVDKPGKGAFYATDLHEMLTVAGITSLLVTGVTTEVCVHTTVREANDRGYEALVVSDCVGSYFPEFQRVGLAMIAAQGGIFGWVADSAAVIGALATVPQEVRS